MQSDFSPFLTVFFVKEGGAFYSLCFFVFFYLLSVGTDGWTDEGEFTLTENIFFSAAHRELYLFTQSSVMFRNITLASCGPTFVLLVVLLALLCDVFL